MSHTSVPEGRLTVSPAEAAALIGVSHTTIRRWLAAGTLPSVKIRHVTLIRLEDLHALAAGELT